ncbi:primosomal protein N' (replication factor Y) - superfamily II helicase [Halovulum dunhuangense]|uniref:Primosomal protein N' (Replication factor Y) -superfamily II helicase n=1 Tax=Halovulum dunhuangense TaxID=1505036 RepID=A0A849L129_9RHOB|nr:primosomal protein N' (replication factor Y) - superfamily II helicase [Halovulum dunhuangense]NNU79982.1 primosomal protein N' (replication factor Y) - superfamily II helicase [Halovulum dunhuangense]
MTEARIEEHRFPCPTCGSDLRYLPGTTLLHCDHCGAEQEIEGEASGPWGGAKTLAEQDFAAAVDRTLPEAEMEETRVSSCPSCGAQVEFDPDTHAAECPFCATPVVTDTGTHRHIKPRGVLPFLLTEREARDAMTRWLGRLWFAPSGLTDYARKGRRMQGIYVPYWTYDADTKTRYTGQRGIVHHETRMVRVMVNGKPQTRSQQVAKVRWTPVSGRVARFFDDVLVLASRSLPKQYTDALAPWDLHGLMPYAPEYLAGFRAEAYQVPLEEGYAEARAIMEAQIRRDIRFDIGGDRQQIGRVETDISGLTFKHVLLPVWLAAYKYNGQTYRFVVNARTGAVQGERPWSAWKIAVAVVLLVTVAAAVGYVVAVTQ